MDHHKCLLTRKIDMPIAQGMERRRMGQRKMCIYLLDALCHSPIEQCEININETFSLSPSSGFANIPNRYRSAKRFSFFKKRQCALYWVSNVTDLLLVYLLVNFAHVLSRIKWKSKVQKTLDRALCALCVSLPLSLHSQHIYLHIALATKFDTWKHESIYLQRPD